MSTGSTQPFRPSGTATVAATSSPATAALVGIGDSALIFNATASTAFVSFGATVADAPSGTAVPIPAGARCLLNCGPFAGAVAITLTSGTGNVYVTLGTGTVY